jgi:hypothetical protein
MGDTQGRGLAVRTPTVVGGSCRSAWPPSANARAKSVKWRLANFYAKLRASGEEAAGH